MDALIDIQGLAQMLNSRAASLAPVLLPDGHPEGAEWVEAKRAAGGMGDSLKVRRSGARAGTWAHFAAGRSGDMLDLVAYLHFNDDKGMAVRWAKEWLGLENGGTNLLQERRKLAEQNAQALEAERKRVDKECGRAFAIWLSAKEKLRGTLAERYLLGRKIDLSRLARQPRALRFHPGLWNAELQIHAPALVATINAAGGPFLTMHRIWLQQQSDGRVTKLACKAPKKAYGIYKGGLIPIWRGAGKLALKRAPEGSSIVLTEGIEDALSVALASPERRVCATISIGNMANIELPPAIADIVICADNDGDNIHAKRSLVKAINTFLEQGRKVSVARPPAGCHDMNELSQRG